MRVIPVHAVPPLRRARSAGIRCAAVAVAALALGGCMSVSDPGRPAPSVSGKQREAGAEPDDGLPVAGERPGRTDAKAAHGASGSPSAKGARSGSSSAAPSAENSDDAAPPARQGKPGGPAKPPASAPARPPASSPPPARPPVSPPPPSSPPPPPPPATSPAPHPTPQAGPVA
ncbi:hypothetical protein [Streptomyces orinoci]|uniref:Lipoprotein n=1 Tax=Streptomyces orinoci TaxID=67339 RepID=A0ABV3K1H4_STRON|nr:hypothetical protein [Streptomyces orinoci]